MLTRKLLVGLAAATLLTGCAQATDPATSAPAPTTATVTSQPAETTTPGEVSNSPSDTLEPGKASDSPSDNFGAQPTWAQVPVAEDLMYAEYPTPMTATDGEGMGQAAVGLCDPGEWAEPTTTLRREFTYDKTGAHAYTTVVFGYDSTEAATEGYDTIMNAAANCAEQMKTTVPLENTRVEHEKDLTLDPSGIDAETVRADYFVGVGSNPAGDGGWFNITTLVQTDNRVAWIVETLEGMDYNCTVTAGDDDIMQCPVGASLPTIAERLASDS